MGKEDWSTVNVPKEFKLLVDIVSRKKKKKKKDIYKELERYLMMEI